MRKLSLEDCSKWDLVQVVADMAKGGKRKQVQSEEFYRLKMIAQLCIERVEQDRERKRL